MTPEFTSLGMCSRCAHRLGVVAMPPSARPPLPCARCGHTILLRAIPRELSEPTSGKDDSQGNAPMFVTYRVNVTDGFFGRFVDAAEGSAGMGLLEMFVCRACGFVEWYCNDAANLPVGPQYMTEEIDVSSSTPYR